jgi:gamma-glutamyltranspeptidase/glutathione hydrolase
MRHARYLSTMFVLAFLLFGCASNPSNDSGSFQYQVPAYAQKAPEGSSGYNEKPGWFSQKFMVAAANPLATDAGYQILKAGGTAVDAVIAVQMVLTLVEPQSSGIGGGAFMIHSNGREVVAFDGRETAPAGADEKLFFGADGKPLNFMDGVVGGRSVGTPGVLRMLEMAHKRYGKLPWATLFQPSIKLAEQGFAVSPRLNAMLKDEKYLASNDPAAKAYFYNDDGSPRAIGTILKNPELAATLKTIAQDGPDAFYRGPIARDIVAKVTGHPRNPGKLAETDLINYRAKERAPLCFDYRAYRFCGMPPPSSGAIALAQILGILENSDIAKYKPVKSGKMWQLSPDAVHLYSEAARLAYADRGLYVADSDFINVPAGLTDKAYLQSRSKLIGPNSMGSAKPGVPPGVQTAWAADRSPELPSTSHISVIDANGNAISITTTVEDIFGARLMVRGFLLNNQLTDFSFADRDEAGRPIANRVQANKRPRSSMSPTLVFDKASGKLVLSVGSPGGSAIINYVGKTLIATLD